MAEPREIGTDEDPLLRIADLSVAYRAADGFAPVVRGVSLDIHRGETVGLVGESGCGKTTLARALMGMLPLSARLQGSVSIGETELIGADENLWQSVRGHRIGLVPQDAMSSLDPLMRVDAQVAEVVRAAPRARVSPNRGAARRAAIELLGEVGLDARAARCYPHELSGGMRQRAVIAHAIAGGAQIIIADEPTTGLDVLLAGRILDLFGELVAARRIAVLLISHDLDAVYARANRVFSLQQGRLVARGPGRSLPSPDSSRGDRRSARQDRARAGSDRPDRATEPLVAISGARKTFSDRRGFGRAREHPVLDGVDLEIAAGEIVGLIGLSGSGKTTIARSLVGLVRPERGRILVAGQDVCQLRGAELRRYRRGVSIIEQDPYDALHPAMRVAELVAEPLRIAGRRGDLRVNVCAALRTAGLPNTELLNSRPHSLSGGQRQRVVIARALIAEPRLLIADEPTGMLDASHRAGISATLARLRDDRGLAILLITHNLLEAARICDRIAVLHQGRIIETGPAGDVLAAPRHEHTRELMDAAVALRE